MLSPFSVDHESNHMSIGLFSFFWQVEQIFEWWEGVQSMKSSPFKILSWWWSGSFADGTEFEGGRTDTDWRRLCRYGCSPAFLFSGKPLVTVGEEAPGLVGVKATLFLWGTLTSRKALAPQLILLANGLFPTFVGLPLAGSESSIALSSTVEVADDVDETDPLLKGKLVWIDGGELPDALDILMRRLLFAWAAAVVIGPG